jgi:type IV pilus assembly protein PilA
LTCKVFWTRLAPVQALHNNRATFGSEEQTFRVDIRKAHGFALIDLIFVCGIIGLISSIAVPRMLLARQTAAAASAIGSLRAINSGELTYALTCASGFYAPNLSTLGTAPPGSNEAFIGFGLGAADVVTKTNYIFQLSGTAYAAAPATCNGLAIGAAAQGYKAAADATEPTNVRFFATNATGTIWEDTSTLFAVAHEVDPPASGHPIH